MSKLFDFSLVKIFNVFNVKKLSCWICSFFLVFMIKAMLLAVKCLEGNAIMDHRAMERTDRKGSKGFITRIWIRFLFRICLSNPNLPLKGPMTCYFMVALI